MTDHTTKPTAEQLGQMSDEELQQLQRCEQCLEPYDWCRCATGRIRRREEAQTDA